MNKITETESNFIDYAYYMFGMNNNKHMLHNMPISLTCYFLLQVYRVVKYYYIVESRTVWPNLWRVVNLIHILLILAHWFGCFYYLLSEAEGFQVIPFFSTQSIQQHMFEQLFISE